MKQNNAQLKASVKILVSILLMLFIVSCQNSTSDESPIVSREISYSDLADSLAAEVKAETMRSWLAYKKYAWGHDVLKPISGSFADWYDQPLYISPIDAYSTLKIMGFEDEAETIEIYVIDSLQFNLDLEVKVFEVNIRILGGLLSMYELSGNSKILKKAEDFAQRILPAFNTQTGIPTYWVNLKTGEATGEIVNVAEAGTYLIEMGMLSRHTGNPVYYNAAKKSSLAVFERRSELNLIGDVINVQTGEWVSTDSYICAGVDSYYEYLFKGFLLFHDNDLENCWEVSIGALKKYLPDTVDNRIWYSRVNMNTGEFVSSRVTLYDAFFPGLLMLAGDTSHAKTIQQSWDWLWNQYGLEPMAYDYRSNDLVYPAYQLNPEIIESAYYLYHFTHDKSYFDRVHHYWESIKTHCITDIAFTSIEDVQTMQPKDYMPTFFFAETLKYFYLTFTDHTGQFNFDTHIFSTEAHPFKRLENE